MEVSNGTTTAGRVLRKAELPWATALVILVAAVLFTLPFAVKQNSWAEWGTAYWGIKQQAQSIASSGLPTRFVSTPESGAFYPWFVFYSGGVSAALGYVAQVIGAWGAFLLSIALAFAAAAYGALLALRAFGCPPRLALLLALAAAFSPYMVTNLYGRGAWAELLGASAAWLVVGAGLALLCAESDSQRIRRLLLVALAACTLALSHNISLAIGFPFALVIWVGFVAVGGRGVTQRRDVYLLVGALFSGLLLAGTWLVPNLAFSNRTQVSSWDTFGGAANFDELRVLFSPFLYYPEAQRELIKSTIGAASLPNERLFNQTLTLLLIPVAWVVAQLVVMPLQIFTRPKSSFTSSSVPARNWKLLSLLLISVLAATFLMTSSGIWDSLPAVFQLIQYPYRINSYLTLMIVLCVGVAALIASLRPGNRSAYLPVLITALAIFYLVLGVYQSLSAQRVAPTGFDAASREQIDATGTPPVWANAAPPGQFQFIPSRAVTRPAEALNFLESGGVAQSPATGLLASDVVCSPLVRFSGPVRVVGSDSQGKCVLEVSKANAPVEVVGSFPLAPLLGTLGSVIGLVLLVVLVSITWRRSEAV